MNKISRRMEKIKFQSFGKVKRKISSINNDKDLQKLYDEKIKNNENENNNLDDEINKKILEYQLRDYERKLHYLNELKKRERKVSICI